MDWRVTIRCPDWAYASKVAASNASEGGLFLLTTKLPAVNSPVELTVELPDGSSLSLKGIAQHIVTPERAVAEGRSPGVGIKFDAEHKRDLLILQTMAQAGGLDGSPAVSDEASKSAPQATPTVQATPAKPTPQATPAQAVPVIASGGFVPRKSGTGSGAMARAVGIDFGTTYTSASVGINEEVEIISDASGRRIHPSIVSYTEAGVVTGWEARKHLITDPRNTIQAAKRLLGHSFSDVRVSALLHSAPFKTLRGPNDSIIAEVRGGSFAIAQVCAEMLRSIRRICEQRLERSGVQAVLTYPVSFSEQQKASLQTAAKLAGLEVIGMIEEPVAAALAYGFGQEKSEIIAVYDFGGGTFDFSILDLNSNLSRVIGLSGDTWLGGDDFDLVLAQWVADKFWRDTGVELRRRVVDWSRLVMECEQVKRRLSTETAVDLELKRVVETPRPLDLKERIDRARMEDLSKELLARSITVCQEALDAAGLEPRDMTQVVVSGGVSRMPLIRNGLSEFFDREIIPLVNPDEAVSLGAGVHAAKLVEHTARRVCMTVPSVQAAAPVVVMGQGVHDTMDMDRAESSLKVPAAEVLRAPEIPKGPEHPPRFPPASTREPARGPSKVTSQLVSLSLMSEAQYRIVLRVRDVGGTEWLASGVIDARRRAFEAEGPLVAALTRSKVMKDPDALDRDARFEWEACGSIERYVENLIGGGVL